MNPHTQSKIWTLSTTKQHKPVHCPVAPNSPDHPSPRTSPSSSVRRSNPASPKPIVSIMSSPKEPPNRPRSFSSSPQVNTPSPPCCARTRPHPVTLQHHGRTQSRSTTPPKHKTSASPHTHTNNTNGAARLDALHHVSPPQWSPPEAQTPAGFARCPQGNIHFVAHPGGFTPARFASPAIPSTT